MAEPIDNEKILHLLSQTYAVARMNHQLLMTLLARTGQENIAEIFPMIQERIAKTADQTRRLYTEGPGDDPELPEVDFGFPLN